MDARSVPRTRVMALGIAASLFFSITFIVNRLMSLSGGHWLWSASLRFILMVPFLFAIVAARHGLGALFSTMKRDPAGWLIWSTVGFGFFYAPLTFAAAFGPSWLVAGTWQTTIMAGIIVAPLTGKPFSARAFRFSAVILAGILLMQTRQASLVPARELAYGIVPVLFAAFAYPLGNRKMMQIAQGRLDVYQRILGMTLASLPFWIALSALGFTAAGLPDKLQLVRSLVVAVSSGVIATSLFFKGTDQARGDQSLLGAVEATQSGEVLFALAGDVILLGGAIPDALALAGMGLVVLGVILHSLGGASRVSSRQPE